MASIYIYNSQSGKCLELFSTRISEQDIQKLKALLPQNLQGLAFSPEELPVESRHHHLTENEGKTTARLKAIAKRLLQLRQWLPAAHILELAFRISGEPEVLLLRAEVLSQIGEVEKSDRLLQRYLEMNPEEPSALFLLGKHALNRSDYVDAQDFFQKAISHGEKLGSIDLKESLKIHLDFVSIYLERDELFSRDLASDSYIAEVQKLQARTAHLKTEIQKSPQAELQGMIFFLDHQIKTFEQWLLEMEGRKS